MGLDWQVGGKPKPGSEAEFRALFAELTSGDEICNKDDKVRRFQSIMTLAHETLGAPMVGRDAAATEWAREQYLARNPNGPVDAWLAEVQGQYVLQILPPCDGIPRYSGGGLGYTGLESFRAEFLKDCVAIIGEDMLEEAFKHKMPSDLVDYGRRLGRAAVAYAKPRGLDPNTIDGEDPDSDEFRINVVVAAAKWCVFWGSRGHYLEPDF